jgi:lipopolysaccharide transport system permease protein
MLPVRTYDAAAPLRWARSAHDINEGLSRWRLAWVLARSDITHRYRGSVLGPLWMTISTAVMLAALGFLYAKLFRIELSSYLPWLSVSLIVWNIINQVLAEACTTLTSAEGIIRQMPLAYSVQAIRMVFRNALVAAHNLPLIIVIFLIFGVSPGWGVLYSIIGFVLLAINAFWAALFLGVLCARFRDIPPIVASVVQIMFFVTPVIWKPELVGEWSVYLPLNPFFAIMETIRGPIMGTPVPLGIWVSAIICTLVLSAAALAFFTRFRGRIAFWV